MFGIEGFAIVSNKPGCREQKATEEIQVCWVAARCASYKSGELYLSDLQAFAREGSEKSYISPKLSVG